MKIFDFFGEHELTNEMIYNAETFLLRYITYEKLDSSDNLRLLCLPRNTSTARFREVSTNKQHYEATCTSGLFAVLYVALYFY